LLLLSSVFRLVNHSSSWCGPRIIATTRNGPLHDLVFVSFPRVKVIPTLQASPAKVKFHLRTRIPIRGRFVHRQSGRGSISAMVQGYYTLQEAAEVLGMGLDDL